MVTPQETAQCVFYFIETKSDVQTQQRYTTKYRTRIHVQTQRSYRTKYAKDPPSRSSIHRSRTTKRLSYTLDVFGGCSWSPTSHYIQHWPCLHKFPVLSMNWRTWWWIFYMLAVVLYLWWVWMSDFVSMNQDTHCAVSSRSNHSLRVYLTHS